MAIHSNVRFRIGRSSSRVLADIDETYICFATNCRFWQHDYMRVCLIAFSWTATRYNQSYSMRMWDFEPHAWWVIFPLIRTDANPMDMNGWFALHFPLNCCAIMRCTYMYTQSGALYYTLYFMYIRFVPIMFLSIVPQLRTTHIRFAGLVM